MTFSIQYFEGTNLTMPYSEQYTKYKSNNRMIIAYFCKRCFKIIKIIANHNTIYVVTLAFIGTLYLSKSCCIALGEFLSIKCFTSKDINIWQIRYWRNKQKQKLDIQKNKTLSQIVSISVQMFFVHSFNIQILPGM